MKPSKNFPSLSEGGLRVAVERFIKQYFDLHGDHECGSGLYAHVLKEMEIPLISETLKVTRGNQLKAAYILGVNRNTLRKKIRTLKISVPFSKERSTSNLQEEETFYRKRKIS